jgi:hypothetical protein
MACGTLCRLQPVQVVVAVTDRQVMGQVQRLCRDLEVPAADLEGRAAGEKLRAFSLPSSSSWVLILWLGHQVRPHGCILLCCSLQHVHWSPLPHMRLQTVKLIVAAACCPCSAGSLLCAAATCHVYWP